MKSWILQNWYLKFANELCIIVVLELPQEESGWEAQVALPLTFPSLHEASIETCSKGVKPTWGI